MASVNFFRVTNLQEVLRLQDILILKEEVLWDVNSMSPDTCGL